MPSGMSGLLASSPTHNTGGTALLPAGTGRTERRLRAGGTASGTSHGRPRYTEGRQVPAVVLDTQFRRYYLFVGVQVCPTSSAEIVRACKDVPETLFGFG